ncbi:MAG: nitrile hydratase subunit beta [Geminicoccaceae bacterium]|nr:MAG: nitrile hydratase subunit beta [Geminicoccaceae bacterium]
MSALRVGARVRVRAAFPPGHVRTPFYTRGKIGRIEALAGHYADPEALAYGQSGLPAKALWRVRFPMTELWSDAETPEDQLVVDLYEHWLEAIDG